MAVALRGYTQGSKASAGTSLAWPSGTVAGDLALVHTGGSLTGTGPQSSGWSPVGHKSWWKIVTAADLAANLVVTATHVKLQTFSGAGGVGRYSSQPGVNVAAAGSGVWLDGQRPGANIAPATYRLGAEFIDESGWSQGAYFIAAPAAGYVSIPSPASGSEWYAYEVTPATVPTAPVLVAPLAGAHVDQTLPVTFSWRHQAAIPQVAYRVRLVSALGTQWITAAGALSSSEQTISGDAQSITLNAALLSTDWLIQWSVQTQTANGWGDYAAARDLYADTPAWASSITVAAPAEDLSPVVSWSPVNGSTASVSGSTPLPPVAYRVRILPAAAASPDTGALYDSGVIQSTATTHNVPASAVWTNGGSYKAWVSLYTAGGPSADRASTAFTISWTAPAAPTVTASASVSPPTVSVSGLEAGHPVEVQQALTPGVWTPLASRTATGATLTGLASPLAATGSPVSFRARQGATIDGVSAWSAWSSTVTVTAPAAGCWLVDDTDRSSYVVAHLREESPREVVQGVSVTYGLGAAGARVDRTLEAGESGSLVWICDTQAERDAVATFLMARQVFWYVFPPDEGLALRPVRMARTSPRSWDRLAQTGVIAHRLLPMSWVEQPEGA